MFLLLQWLISLEVAQKCFVDDLNAITVTFLVFCSFYDDRPDGIWDCHQQSFLCLRY